MNTLADVISQANDLLTTHAAVAAAYDPNATPLRTIPRDEETAILKGEERSLSGIQRLLDGITIAKAALENPDYSDEVKADIYVKLNVLLNGLPE